MLAPRRNRVSQMRFRIQVEKGLEREAQMQILYPHLWCIRKEKVKCT